jgi:hypothetical protein
MHKHDCFADVQLMILRPESRLVLAGQDSSAKASTPNLKKQKKSVGDKRTLYEFPKQENDRGPLYAFLPRISLAMHH